MLAAASARLTIDSQELQSTTGAGAGAGATTGAGGAGAALGGSAVASMIQPQPVVKANIAKTNDTSKTVFKANLFRIILIHLLS
jgi:hypothetical protein